MRNCSWRAVSRTRLVLFVVFFLLVEASTALSQNPETSQSTPPARPIQMLVLGDSILWGQGLKREHKISHYVKLWLEKNTARQVVERMEAHSGAVVERSALTDSRTSPDREVNLGLPTINEEIDSALRFYSNPAQVDVVLVSGCGNDVGLQKLLNAETTDEVDDITEAKCGKPMENLLRRITTAFPAAHVIVTGYYPFFSDETRHDFVLKALARRFLKTRPDGGNKLSSKEVFERLKTNSVQWHKASDNELSKAVDNINSEQGRRRVTFVKIEFPAVYAFAAPKTRLWGFNRSPLRMVLLFISFGKVPLPSNDEMRKQRSASCKELYKKQPNETEQEKKDRKGLTLFCRYAALGHPNRKGALLYADAITIALKPILLTTASTTP